MVFKIPQYPIEILQNPTKILPNPVHRRRCVVVVAAVAVAVVAGVKQHDGAPAFV